MKFSVATPTRNSLSKLRRCVGSVRGQCGTEVEHIIQDALSGDETAAWLASQSGLDWRSEADSGMYDAINRCWSRSNGDVLCWLNSDEQYLPGTLKKVAAFFEENPEIDVLYGDALVIAKDGRLIAARRETRLCKLYVANGFLNAFSCTTFFRRHLFESGILNLDRRYRYAADMDLILRLLESNVRIAKLDDYLAAFMLDGENLSCHQGMLDETSEIQRRHGGFNSKMARRLIMCGRYVERFVSGSYRAVNISYAFCVDEVPNYKWIAGRLVPGSYRTR